jgi:transposase
MTDDLATKARRLRTEEGLSVRQIQERLGVGRDRLREWLGDIPPPAWTRRPRAKDDLRERAVAMRGEGASVDEIAAALGVSKSSAYLWVRHLPLARNPETEAVRRRATAEAGARARWAGHRGQVAARRARIALDAEQGIGTIGMRELMLIGAVMYWCEGTKAKPWRAEYRVVFINSDLGLLRIFLAFLEAIGIPRAELVCRVSIHETADAVAATRWWAERLELPVGSMRRPTIKRHESTTVRRNTGDQYHGCLKVAVPRSRELYWWIEEAMSAITGGLPPAQFTRPEGAG